MGGGGSGNTTVTNQTVLPQWVQDAAQTNLAQAKAISQTPYQAYSGQTVAGLTPDQQSAYDWVRQNSTNAATAAGNAADSITGGNLITTATGLLNPYLGNVESSAIDALQRTGQQQQNALAANAANVGAFGGDRYAIQAGTLGSETARQAGDLSNQIRSQGWNQAVQTALTQAGTVAGLAGQQQQIGLQGAAALEGAGTQEQTQDQSELNDLYKRWADQQNYPLEQLAINQSALTSTPYGGTSTTTQPYQGGSPLLSGLGGALSMGAAGAGIGGALAGGAAGSILPGIGTGIGALVGLLGGLSGKR